MIIGKRQYVKDSGKGEVLKAHEIDLTDRQPKGLFVSDLDGTLLTDEKQIAGKDLAVLFRLRQMGYLNAVATGRSNYSFKLLIKNLAYSRPGNTLPIDFIIFSTGAGIMDYPAENLLQSFSLAPEEVHLISNYLEKSAIDYMIHSPIPDTSHFLFSSHHRDNPDFQRRVNLYRDFATPLKTLGLKEFGRATEVLCILPPDGAHEYAVRITDALGQFSVIKATSPLDGRSIWIEIFAPGASKGQAIRWLAATKAIDRENICAVGNDYNDEDLLHWAGTAYIVANSPTSMHSHFPTVVSNNQGGVSEAVTRWLARSPNRNGQD
jgi:HAD superfamily hydrolase (TIGR01484 family)